MVTPSNRCAVKSGKASSRSCSETTQRRCPAARLAAHRHDHGCRERRVRSACPAPGGLWSLPASHPFGYTAGRPGASERKQLGTRIARDRGSRGCRPSRARAGAWDGCKHGVGGYLLAKLVSGGVLRAHEPLLEASIEMAGKLAPGRQSCRVNARAGVRYQVARFGGPPPGLRIFGWAAGAQRPCAVLLPPGRAIPAGPASLARRPLSGAAMQKLTRETGWEGPW